jgi:Flp pilus assembly pilin Flp
MLQQLWRDQQGAVISAEACIFGVILVVGLIAGIASVQTALVGELGDVSDAIAEFDFTPNPIVQNVQADNLNSPAPPQQPLTAADMPD